MLATQPTILLYVLTGVSVKITHGSDYKRVLKLSYQRTSLQFTTHKCVLLQKDHIYHKNQPLWDFFRNIFAAYFNSEKASYMSSVLNLKGTSKKVIIAQNKNLHCIWICSEVFWNVSFSFDIKFYRNWKRWPEENCLSMGNNSANLIQWTDSKL